MGGRHDPGTTSQSDPLTDIALGWLVRLHSGDETEADWNAYHDWKAESPDNAAAAARAEHVWSRLGPALKPRGSVARRIAGALVLLACLGGAGVMTGAAGPMAGWFADEATGIGERRVVTLADGSAVTMDSATSLDVEFAPAERRIVLREGQIFVQVAADAARPFIVEARAGTVRALGTAFNVSTVEAGARIAVTEHRVRVSYGAAGSVEVGEGQSVAYAPEHGLGIAGAIDSESVTAWQRGEILFDGRPLGDVAAEMARYRRGTVVFTDDSLKRLPVTGVFSTKEGDDFFDALERTLPVRVTRLPYLTLIRRDPSRALGPYAPEN